MLTFWEFVVGEVTKVGRYDVVNVGCPLPAYTAWHRPDQLHAFQAQNRCLSHTSRSLGSQGTMDKRIRR